MVRGPRYDLFCVEIFSFGVGSWEMAVNVSLCVCAPVCVCGVVFSKQNLDSAESFWTNRFSELQKRSSVSQLYDAMIKKT